MSATGSTSARISWNIRNISAVQRPMPLTSTSASMSASSSSAGHSPRIETRRREMLREIADVFGLVQRQSACAQRCDALALHTGRVERSARARLAGFQDALPDRLRRLDRNLLSDDRARQRGERVAPAGRVETRKFGDQLGEHAIARGKRLDRIVPIGRLGHRGQDPSVAAGAPASGRRRLPSPAGNDPPPARSYRGSAK